MEKTRLTEKATLRKNIREYIKEQIASGRFKAGDRVVETQLAKELNVSQAPVREAVLELSAMGLLEERPYSGSFVPRILRTSIIPAPSLMSTPPGRPPNGLQRSSWRKWRLCCGRWMRWRTLTTLWKRI